LRFGQHSFSVSDTGLSALQDFCGLVQPLWFVSLNWFVFLLTFLTPITPDDPVKSSERQQPYRIILDFLHN
jgi:hypothetical protein